MRKKSSQAISGTWITTKSTSISCLIVEWLYHATLRIRFSPAFAHIQYVLPIFFLFLQNLLFLFPDFDTGLLQIQRLQLRGGGTKPVQRRRKRLDWQSPDRDRDYSSDERSFSDHGMSCDSEWIPETSSTSSVDNSSEGRILSDYPRNVVSI
jgi:hypothetical protein